MDCRDSHEREEKKREGRVAPREKVSKSTELSRIKAKRARGVNKGGSFSSSFGP
jgi:hypothetical protein